MDEAIKLLYRLFLGSDPYKITSCKLNDNAVEISIRLWKDTKPYKVILKPAEEEIEWTSK